LQSVDILRCLAVKSTGSNRAEYCRYGTARLSDIGLEVTGERLTDGAPTQH